MTAKIEHVVTTSDELENFMADAKPGDVCVYHRGHLAYDASREASNLDEVNRLRLTLLGNIAYALCRQGTALLVQRREGEDFAYLAIRSSKAIRTNGAAKPASLPEVA